jgi:hypothetical protein
VRDLDMVVTTTGYVWHRDMPNKEVKAGGGTVDMPVRMDRSGVAKGLILSRTKAELQCTATYVHPPTLAPPTYGTHDTHDTRDTLDTHV